MVFRPFPASALDPLPASPFQGEGRGGIAGVTTTLIALLHRPSLLPLPLEGGGREGVKIPGPHSGAQA